MYGKLKDGALEVLRLPIVVGGERVWTSDRRTLLDMGWKPVIPAPRPAAGDGAAYVSEYEEADTEIRQKWVRA